MAKRASTVRTEDRPVDDNTMGEPDHLATVIRQISQDMRSLLKSGLNRDAIVILLSHSTGEGKRTVANILDGLEGLAEKYTTSP